MEINKEKIEEAAKKLHEALDTARFWQRENGDLRM